MLLLYVIWAPKNTFSYKRTWNVQERIPWKLHQTAGGSRPKKMHPICAIWVLFYYLELMLWIFLGFSFYIEKVDPASLMKKNIYDNNQRYTQWKCHWKFVHICQAKCNTDFIFVIHTLVFYVNVFWKWHPTHLSKSE